MSIPIIISLCLASFGLGISVATIMFNVIMGERRDK